MSLNIGLQPPLTIGLHAPKGTGKDTVARGFRDKAVDPWQRQFCHLDKFALPLYKAISALTGWSTEQLEDETTKEVIWTPETAPTQSLVGWSPRKLLEFLGTEVVRDKLGATHWVELMHGRLARRVIGVTLITDVRFVNECSVCDAVIELRREGKDYDDGHVSHQRLPAGCITETIWLPPRDEIRWGELAERIIGIGQWARERKS